MLDLQLYYYLKNISVMLKDKQVKTLKMVVLKNNINHLFRKKSHIYLPFRQVLPLRLNVCSSFIDNQCLIFFFFFIHALFFQFQFVFEERIRAWGWLAVSYTPDNTVEPEGETHNMTSADRQGKKIYHKETRLMPKSLMHK